MIELFILITKISGYTFDIQNITKYIIEKMKNVNRKLENDCKLNLCGMRLNREKLETLVQQ